MKLEKLFENWSNFLKESDNKKDEKVIYEISQGVYDSIADYLGGEVYVEDLHFSNLFDDDKLRMITTFSDPDADSITGQIVKFFEDNGWEFETVPREVTVKKTVRRDDGTEERVSSQETRNDIFVKRLFKVDEEKAKKFAKGGKGPKDQMRKVKLGKMLEKLSKVVDKVMPRGEEGGHSAFDRVARKDPTWKKLQEPQGPFAEGEFPALERHDVGLGNYAHFKELGTGEIRIKAWNKFWSQKSEHYSANPEEFFEQDKKYIIFTRDPIDVLKMSDSDRLESCHREGHSHFHCAQKEARSAGFVAYMIDEGDWDTFLGQYMDEDADIQEELTAMDGDEIFQDEQRGIKGLEPLARVRVRRYVNYQDETELAVPETRTYPSRTTPGFYEAVKAWIQKGQETPETILDPNNDVRDVNSYMDEFYLTGGSYADNSASDLWNRFFDTDVFSGDVEYDDEGREESEFEGMGRAQEWQSRIDEIMESANRSMEHCGVYGEVYDEGAPDELWISYSGDGTIEIPAIKRAVAKQEKGEDPEYVDLDDLEEDIDDIALEIRDLLEEEISYPDLEYRSDGIEIEEGRNNEILIRLRFSTDNYGHDPDSFEEFAGDIEREWEGNWSDVTKLAQKILRKYGAIERTAVEIYADAARQFEHFDIDESEEGFEIEQTMWTTIGTGLNLPAILAAKKYTENKSGIYDEEWNRGQFPGSPVDTIEWNTFRDKLFDLMAKEIMQKMGREEEGEKQTSLKLDEARSKTKKFEWDHKNIYGVLKDGFKVWFAPAQMKAGKTAADLKQWNAKDYEPIKVPIQMRFLFKLNHDLSEGLLEHALRFIDYIDENMDEVAKIADSILQKYNVEYQKHVNKKIAKDEKTRKQLPELKRKAEAIKKDYHKTIDLLKMAILGQRIQPGSKSGSPFLTIKTSEDMPKWVDKFPEWDLDYQPILDDWMEQNVWFRASGDDAGPQWIMRDMMYLEGGVANWKEGTAIPEVTDQFMDKIQQTIKFYERSKGFQNEILQHIISLTMIYKDLEEREDWPEEMRIAWQSRIFSNPSAPGWSKTDSHLWRAMDLLRQTISGGWETEGDMPSYHARNLASIRTTIRRYQRRTRRAEEGATSVDLLEELENMESIAEKHWRSFHQLGSHMATMSSRISYDLENMKKLKEKIIQEQTASENQLTRRQLGWLNYFRRMYGDQGQLDKNKRIDAENPHGAHRSQLHRRFVYRLQSMLDWLDKGIEIPETAFARPENQNSEAGNKLIPLRDNVHTILGWLQSYSSREIPGGTTPLLTMHDFFTFSHESYGKDASTELKDSYHFVDRWLNNEIGRGAGDYDGLLEELPYVSTGHAAVNESSRSKRAYLNMFKKAGII